MKKIGLSTENLFNRGVAKHAVTSSELTSEVFQNNDLLNNPNQLQAELNVVKEEAIIKAVAVMIEENNDALLTDLKKLGVIEDQK